MAPDHQGAYEESGEVVIVMKRETSPVRVAVLGRQGGGTKGLWGLGLERTASQLCVLSEPQPLPWSKKNHSFFFELTG